MKQKATFETVKLISVTDLRGWRSEKLPENTLTARHTFDVSVILRSLIQTGKRTVPSIEMQWLVRVKEQQFTMSMCTIYRFG